MSELIPIFKQFGVWIGVLIVVTYFLLVHWWPWWKEERAKDRAFREGQLNRIQEREDEIIAEMTQAIKENTETSKAQTTHIEALTNEVRASRRK